MVHIGEIFFASSLSAATEPVSSNPPSSSRSYLSRAGSSFFSFFSPSPSQPSPITHPQKSGLRWTGEALDLAEKTLRSTPSMDSGARHKCAECLDAGMENWSKMVSHKLREAHSARMMVGRQRSSDSEEGPGHGGNWVWQGAGGVDGFGVDAAGFGLGTKPESKTETGTGTGTGSKTSEERKRSKEEEDEEEEWNQEALRIKSETSRLKRVLREEGLLVEPWAGRRMEPGLMNR